MKVKYPSPFKGPEFVYIDGLFGRHTDLARAAAEKGALPNTFIVGAAKSGTTTLAATLARHPNIFVCRPKEPKFFGAAYTRGWDWYAGLFARGKGRAVRIDASTMYSSAEPLYLGTPQMIAAYIPEARIIYLVRHPLERVISHWRHWKGRQADKFGSFDDILARDRERRLFIETTRYHDRLDAWRRHFPDEQILCLTFEDMVAQPSQFLDRTLRFLSLRSSSSIVDRLLTDGRFEHHNPAGAEGRAMVPRPRVSPDLHRAIVAAIAPDARLFLQHIGKPQDYWTGL